jgi:hypothetical protein
LVSAPLGCTTVTQLFGCAIAVVPRLLGGSCCWPDKAAGPLVGGCKLDNAAGALLKAGFKPDNAPGPALGRWKSGVGPGPPPPSLR